MSNWAAREDDMDRFFARDQYLPHVTPQAAGSALAGFALPLSAGKDMNWLAMAVRRSLAICLPNISDGPERTSNADICGELERLAALTGARGWSYSSAIMLPIPGYGIMLGAIGMAKAEPT